VITIDSHQHFWHFDPIRDAWIDDSMKIIQRDFLPGDYNSLLKENGIDGSVAVQADQSVAETEFLLELAQGNSFIKGVVGWVDLIVGHLEERLEHYSDNVLFKGVRHVAQGEANDFLQRSDVQKGIGLLERYGLTYDILVYAHQLPAAIDLVRAFPNQKFVLDHIAKPKISDGIANDWKDNMRKLADLPNVSCKLSGMVTETNDYQWQQEDFQPFLEFVISIFGIGRVMYGSDWPVCLVASSYAEQKHIVSDFIAGFSKEEQQLIMGGNAIQFYNL